MPPIGSDLPFSPDLFTNGLLSTQLPIGLTHMKVLLQPPSTDAPNEITYLYRSVTLSYHHDPRLTS